MTKMFSFIRGKPWNPLGGECHYNCYGNDCWAKQLIKRYQMAKYQGEPRLYDAVLARKFIDGEFIFTQDMNDLFGSWVGKVEILAVLDVIRNTPKTDFLLLTKNPERYLEFVNVLPGNAVLGATIESDVCRFNVSKAPDPARRLAAMIMLSGMVENRLFVSVEPIRNFSLQFLDALLSCNPWGIALGYDNYNCGLDEPLLAFTFKLANDLKHSGITVYRKTFRPSNKENCFSRKFGGYNHCISCDLEEKCREKTENTVAPCTKTARREGHFIVCDCGFKEFA